MYKKILFKIREYNTIIIHRHQKPDGDALGAQLGLKEIIKETFPKKEVYVVGDERARFSFLGKMDVIEDAKYQNALCIILDSGEKSLISDDRYKLGKFKIKIDHHIFKEKYADLELVDTSFESASGLIADIYLKNHMHINKKGASLLFTGIVTDSARFRYDATSPRTFHIASELLKLGFDTNEIYQALYSEDLEMVKLRAKLALKFELTKDNVAYLINTKDDVESLGVDFFTISRGMVNIMSGIKDINIWANFTEDVNGNVVSELRSTPQYNINQIATKYGGGGHKCASGATLKNFEEAKLMLEDLNKLSRGEYGK